VKKHVALTSTQTVFETFTPGHPEAPEAARAILIPELRKAYEDSWANTAKNERMKPYAVIFPKLMKLEKMFVDAGGMLLSRAPIPPAMAAWFQASPASARSSCWRKKASAFRKR
jgi:hypothetical protein